MYVVSMVDNVLLRSPGNLPFSVIQSLASESPFGQPGDTDLGLAYASFFVLVNNVSHAS